MDNGDFLEQREQSDACIGYAESRQNWAKPMDNGKWILSGAVRAERCLHYAPKGHPAHSPGQRPGNREALSCALKGQKKDDVMSSLI